MKSEIVVYETPKSPEAEMFRNLRTNIQFMNADSEKKVMVITSTVPGEGKSFVSANLAAAFAQIDKKVLIIDTDMRKGRQYTLFNLRPRPGLSNYLSGVVDQDFKGNKDNIENYIQATYIDNLYLIAAGSVPPNPSELLVSSKMEKIKDKLIDKFDVIIFDAPPCLIVADALIISRLVDFNIIVSAQNITKKEDLIKARDTIEKVGGKVAGIVLNKVQMSAKSYENSYYYGERLTNFKPKRRK
ncbi:MAG TPA: CpsD/CapB family tyrosine-protein kinase [Candidatus Scatovivens faecipullorum]|jgi:capsular exopolysaccharide family|nr:CpsD/CapB family tyrosine-protein kinase [Candidatus Scatovivens faecipullorum]